MLLLARILVWSSCYFPSRKAEEVFKLTNAGAVFPGLPYSGHWPCGLCDLESATNRLVNLSIAKLPKMNRVEFYRSYLVDESGSCKFKDGLEVGALHNPAQVGPCSQNMHYVDQSPPNTLKSVYPELQNHTITGAHLIDDANRLQLVPDATYDFFIASHVIEHMLHTLFAIESWLRVLRPGGLALLIAPNKCASFDSYRTVTNWGHFMRDYNRGLHVNSDLLWKEHLSEWTLSHMNASGCKEYDVNCFKTFKSSYSNFVDTLDTQKKRGGMHFHTWTQASWVNFWHKASLVIRNFVVKGIGVSGELDMRVVLQKI